jgi:RHS repeat-associated protein
MISSPSVCRFHGQRTDPCSGYLHPGNGYREYTPVLKRFTGPDNLSPFDAGGVNSYIWCDGDPVNHSDPTGHLSWQAWTGIGMGILGLGLAVFTAGTSIVTCGTVAAALESATATTLTTGSLGIVSDITAIASGAVAARDPTLASALDWASFATGLAGLTQASLTLLGNGYRTLNRLGLAFSHGLGPLEEDVARAARALRIAEQDARWRQSFIRDRRYFRHELDFGTGEIISQRINSETYSTFRNQYLPDTWTMKINIRDPEEPFYMSDVVQYQYDAVSTMNRFQGQLPGSIIRQNVVNPTTLFKTEGKTGEALYEVFLKETPNGRSTQRILDLFHLRALSVEKNSRQIVEGITRTDFIVSCAPL